MAAIFDKLGGSRLYVRDHGAQVLRFLGSKLVRGTRPEAEARLDRLLSGYPRNHDYRIFRGALVPGLRLYERWRRVRGLYPPGMASFLDIGCCRGFYVLDAALRGARPSAGIDVHAPFVEIARKACGVLGLDGVSFHLADLESVAADPARFGGPFQVVTLLGTYHYLYWGSKLSPKAYGDHATIFEMLARVCSGTLILAGRLDVRRLTRSVRAVALARPGHERYTVEAFREAASVHFALDGSSPLEKDDLFLFRRRSPPI